MIISYLYVMYKCFNIIEDFIKKNYTEIILLPNSLSKSFCILSLFGLKML